MFRCAAALAAGAAVFCVWKVAGIHLEDLREQKRAAHLQSFAAVKEEGAAGTAARQSGAEEDRAEHAAEALPAAAQSSEAVPAGAALVDFPAVLEEAPDTRAWIRIPGTNIHYPVVQGSNNDYYLTHGPDGALSRSGAIFLSAVSSGDFSDRNTILYGHRMNSGTMFAQLHSYTEKSFLDENPYVYVTLPEGQVYTYEIFLVQKVHQDDTAGVYRTQFADSADFAQWLTRKRTGVLAARAGALSAASPVLTLSTCVRGDADARLIVQAQRKDGTKKRKEIE